MSFSYTWKITQLKVKDEVNEEGATLPRAVYQTFWELTGTNSQGQSGTFSGATPFTARNVPEGQFVAFADLTEENVLSWVKNVVNNDPAYKAHIDEQIERRIEEEYGTSEEINPESLPWANTESSVTPSPADDEESPED